MGTKKLYKSKTDRKIWGVCGGLAEYFGVDPTLVRVLWIIAALIGGSGAFAYIIVGFIIPEQPSW